MRAGPPHLQAWASYWRLLLGLPSDLGAVAVACLPLPANAAGSQAGPTSYASTGRPRGLLFLSDSRPAQQPTSATPREPAHERRQHPTSAEAHQDISTRECPLSAEKLESWELNALMQTAVEEEYSKFGSAMLEILIEARMR